ncbi:MAG: peptidyl-alpha-hydroxyglycine alpha-amidating lyase family protein [Pseudohongiellaceae bacterium]
MLGKYVRLICTLVVIGISIAAGTSQAQHLALPDIYSRGDQAFGELAPGREWGAASAIHYAGDGMIWVADRCGGNRGPGSCEDRLDVDPIMLLDSDGNVVRSFGAGLFIWPHGMFVDAAGNLWVTDAATDREGRKGNQVHKFSPEGELLMSLGIAGVRGSGHYYFNAPNDVLVAPNGDIFVADGHSPATDNRIVKYNSEGEYLLQWGSVGAEAGEFRVPHALAMDSQGRLFVADRANSRLQIFDQQGQHISTWTQFGRPSDVYIDGNDILYAADSESDTGDLRNPGWRRGIYIGSVRDGYVDYLIPDVNLSPEGTTSHAEGATADEQGNIYAAEVAERGVRKFTRVAP